MFPFPTRRPRSPGHRPWQFTLGLLALSLAVAPPSGAQEEPSSAQAESAGLTDSVLVPVVLEGVFPPGGRPRPSAPVAGSAYDAKLGAWSLGGNSDPNWPTNRAGFHPATRVIVETSPLRNMGTQGLTARAILAQARTQAYWPMRLCYEDALREQALESPGKTPERGESVLRLAVARSGKVTYARQLRSKLTKDAARCLRQAAYDLRFSPGPKRPVDVEFSVTLSPGDVGVPALPLSHDQAPAPLAETTRWFTEGLSGVRACFAEGLARDPQLWGRLELSVHSSATGLRFAEVTSSIGDKPLAFLDAQVVACTTSALAEKAKSDPLVEPWLAHSPLRVAYRLGNPVIANLQPVSDSE